MLVTALSRGVESGAVFSPIPLHVAVRRPAATTLALCLCAFWTRLRALTSCWGDRDRVGHGRDGGRGAWGRGERCRALVSIV